MPSRFGLPSGVRGIALCAKTGTTKKVNVEAAIVTNRCMRILAKNEVYISQYHHPGGYSMRYLIICLISTAALNAEDGKEALSATFYRDVLPILQDRCQS